MSGKALSLVWMRGCAGSANKCLTFDEKYETIKSVMREKMTTEKRTFKCWNCDKTHPVEVKKDWGFNEVCPECDLYLFDEAEKREKRRW